MPPKGKGQSLTGKNKIFRHAVEHVRIGVGHTILGNVSLTLAAGAPPHTATTDELDQRPAFYLELNEQMLSHSSKDFKTFRYETTPLCETHNLFQMHHKEIAERLIRILLERHSGQFSTSKVQHKKEILQKDKQKRHAEEEEETGLESRGESTEAFEAFARLTIAFARDMKEKFFPYFEIFQSAIHAGLFDGKGQIIPDTTRLQLVFSVQAAWCRELMTYWTEPTHRLLVERIVRRYISQWYDTRDYIRRLTGELLAYLTRMCRPMLHIIVEASMNPLETAFEKFQQNKISEKTGSGDDEEDEEEEDDEASEADEKEKQSTDVVVQDGAVDSVFTLEEYIQADLPVDPVVDGLASLAADLFRGIKGSLSSSFEYYYVYLLVCFGLLNEEEVRRVITSNGSINEKECDFLETAFRQEGHHHPLLLREVGSAVLRRAFTTVLHETRKNSLKALENLSEEEEEIPMEETNGIGREREMVPTHRLLSAVIACLSKSAQVQHISMCGDLLFSFNCLLWNDSHELQSNLQPFAQFLVAALSSVSKQDGEKECHDAVSLAATVLKSVLPLCLSPYSETDSTVALDSDKALAFTLKKQKSFLPAAKAAVDLLLQLATHTSDTVQEQSQQVLLAFAQDVFQKNYSFCLEEERRMAEIGLDVRRRLQDREEAYMEEGGEEQEKRIPSMLTPFAITVLHAIGSWYLKSGCTTLHQSLRCFFHHTVDSLKSRRLVERSVLFAAIANDRTRHMSSSPLRQLMRARTIKKNAPNGPKSGEEDISEMLQEFILQFSQLFLETSRAPSSSHEDKETAAQYLSTLITLVFILPDNEKKTALEEALQKVLSVCIGKGDNFSETSTSTVYSALHAQIAALLVHLSSGAARKKGKGKEGKHNFHHLGETIHILASQFRSASGRTDVDRTRLLQATELLLESLVHALGYTEGSAVRRSTLELLQLLKDSLTVDQQRELLLDVLTECLTSPMQRLRLLSLRLLRLLSQSGIVFGVGSGPAEGALVDWEKEGLHTVNAACLASLQKAEEFNPLSQVGDLNGLKEALAKISFDAERGVMVHPLQRIIVARSMIGLLHLKFAMAWPIALGTLVSLVRQEKTWPDANAKDEEGGEEVTEETTKKKKLSPVVWETVVRHYARLLVFGDVVTHEKQSVYESAVNLASMEEANAQDVSVGQLELSLENLPCPYFIAWTDQQRHSSGALVSQVFSSNAYTTSSLTFSTLVTNEGEVISWKKHCSTTGKGMDRKAKYNMEKQSTDRSTLAENFLKGLADMMKNSAPLDRKLELTESLVEELILIHQGEHPDGLSQLRNVDERIVLAMQACSHAPSTVLTPNELKRFSSLYGTAATDSLKARSEKQIQLFSYYCSYSNSRLQRAAVENLRRLKVFPYSTYYKQLLPYCDSNMKTLFHFLSTFHVETDIPVEDRTIYISTALLIALPRLTARVSKNKLRDQAVLSRRLLAFITHIEADSTTRDAALVQVLNPLVERLLFSKVTFERSHTAEGESPKLDVDFLPWWNQQVLTGYGSLGWGTMRKVDRLLRQIVDALKMLEALLAAAGQRFQDYAYTCVQLSLNAYLFACKSQLREPVEKLLGMINQTNSPITDTNERERLTKWCNGTLFTIAHSKSLNKNVARIRKSAVRVVLALSEQFPDIVASSIRDDVGQTKNVHASLFGRFITHLSERQTILSADGESRTETQSPMLKLVTTWVGEPALQPLLPSFAQEVVHTLGEIFSVSGPSDVGGKQFKVHKASSDAVFVGLRCVTDILKQASYSFRSLADGKTTTLRDSFVKPHMFGIFSQIYALIVKGMESDGGVVEQSADGNDEGIKRKNDKSNQSNKNARHSVMSFTSNMWKEIIQTVSLLTKEELQTTSDTSLSFMMERLLEVSLRFVLHPICVADNAMLRMSCTILEDLCTQIEVIDISRHYLPFVHIFNVMNHPEAREKLCRIFNLMITKLDVKQVASRHEQALFTEEVKQGAVTNKVVDCYASQFVGVSRAVSLLNKFEDNSFERYDFEARYHAFNTLVKFFTLDKSAEATSAGAPQAPSPSLKQLLEDGNGSRAVRRERVYGEDERIELVTDQRYAPFLCSEAFQVLAANVMFFLRDTEKTIRAFAAQTLKAMARYVSVSGMAAHLKHKRRAEDKLLTPAVFKNYEVLILNEVIRKEILHSFRRGIVAKDTLVRHEHMASCEILGQYFASYFPSFAALYTPNVDWNFYKNINHQQPKNRLNALAYLRKEVSHMNVRDLLRVFIPFLIAAVKDFAQGKRQLPNMTEGRAKGYCDAVLLTVSTIAEHLPWDGYHRVLTLFLSNAKLNASLRMPMLRGVVQVLNSFHFLEDSVNEEKPATVEESDHDEDDDNDVEDEDEQVRQEVMQKAKEFKRAKISRVLETDIIPQLYAYINEDEKSGKKVLGIVDGKKGNLHSIANVRRQMEHENNAVTKNAILQLPVAIAIVKIAKHFSEEKFNLYVETLLDWLVKRLRTKNDKHRESARRILGIILQETGPAKLKFLIHKLKDNLVHGYQLHVLGYTVVTLLYQLYDPQNALVATPSHHGEKRAATSGEVLDPVQEVLTKREKKVHTEEADEPEEDNEAETKRKRLEMTEEERLALEEEEIINQLTNASGKTNFDFQFGVTCLTEIMDDLMLIFLDDYLGDIGHEKEQAELMSKMVEVKSNRAVQGFSFLAKHCQADRVMDGFLHRITWVLTPPSDGKSGLTANIAELHGSAKVRALLQRDMMNKYRNGSKNATADIVFVNKVRLLAVRVARNLMVNPTMDVEQSFRQVLRLVQKHNAVRDEKIAAFEAKDGTRRIRGNAHTVIHKAERKTYKEKLENTFLIPKTPDRVDLDFSSHTVLNTQQKTKLRVYKGRYGKELQEAAKDFYREDPTTAVVLDTVDEFLLKYLLSMLKHVLGIGKEKKYSKAAVQLDVLRKQKEKLVTQEEKEEPEEASDQEEAEENDEEAEDELDRFADAQELSTTKKGSKTKDLTMLFTEGHKEILEELVPAVLQTLKGEGSDAVVAMALDSLLALASLRPSLESVKSLGEDLFLTVLIFFERGGHIKQRAMRVCASVLSHSGFELSDDLAKRLVLLCRAEIVQRSTFLPVSLSLLYAVLGRHIMITEIYEMIDLVTELLVHMANKLNVRRLCVSVLVRFLTEYKMTAQKYKSHLELFVKNLDFPTLSGRLGLLDLLESLILHLPTVVLRQEVPLLFVPLSAMLTSCEWKEGREKAGQVMQLLATNAGLDVIAPLLSASLTPDNARPVRTMAMQTWATILLTLSSQLYTTVGGSKSAKKITEDDDEAVRIADPEDQQQFLSATGWSIPHILAGCCVDQYSAHKERLANQQKKRTGKAVKVDAIVLTGEEREKAELTGWTYVYYSLRCVESLVKAVPFVIYPLVAETLIPHLAHVLSGHAHRWVRGAAWRLLTHYFYTVVEEHMSILSEEVSPIAEEEGEESAANHLPYCVVCTGESTEVKDKMIKVFTQYASLTRSLLDRVAASDVKNEKYMAHEMMQDKGRTSLIKLMLFTTRATTRVALDMLTHLPADQEEVHAVIEKQFSTYDKQLAAVTGPVVKRGSVKGFMVRCATLCQYLGGAVSLLPRKEEDSDEAYLEKVTYLYGPTAMNLLPQLQKVILPFLFAVLHSATAEVSERLHGYAMNTIQLIERQIEERQAQLDQVPATTEKDVSPNSKKRKRPAETETAPAKRLKSDKGTTAPVKEGETAVSVRDILTLLQTGTAVSRNVKKEKLIRKETQKVLKRNRHERSKAK